MNAVHDAVFMCATVCTTLNMAGSREGFSGPVSRHACRQASAFVKVKPSLGFLETNQAPKTPKGLARI